MGVNGGYWGIEYITRLYNKNNIYFSADYSLYNLAKYINIISE